MAATLDTQIEKLEKAIENATDSIVRDALQAQLKSVKKKVQSKAGRSIRLSDGVTAKIGDTVYVPGRAYFPVTWSEPTRAAYLAYDDLAPGARIISAIDPTGERLCTSNFAHPSSPSYTTVNIYGSHGNIYTSTPEAAIESMMLAQERAVQNAEAKLRQSQIELSKQKQLHDIIKQYQQNPKNEALKSVKFVSPFADEDDLEETA